jgi:hypothetical protein
MQDTPQNPIEESIWTLSSLREYLLRVIADQANKQSQLAEQQDKAVQAALLAQEKAVSAALAASDKAVQKAEEGALAWRMSANEWRGAMSDRERTFVPRTEFEQSIHQLNDKIDQKFDALNGAIAMLSKYSEQNYGRASGRSDAWAYVLAGVSAFIAVVAILFEVVRSVPKP